jgi:DNA-binding transcriptional LysR family regulator
MELRHLRYFVAVAEERSFTEAAKRLGIKQPPLSAQIRRLEADLGAKLFRRLSRGVELTPAGKAFLEEAQAILEHAERARRGVQSRARGEVGELRVGFAGGTYFHPVILSIIHDYSAEHPHVALSPVQANSATLIAKVEAGEIDIAFVRALRGVKEGGLVLEPLVQEQLVLVVPSSHRLAEASSVPLAGLAGEKFVLFARKLNVPMNDRIVAACRRAGFKPKVALEVADAVSMIPLVAAGFGVALVPNSIAQIQFAGVKYVPIAGEVLDHPIHLTYRPDSPSAAVLNFKLLAHRLAARAAPQRRGRAPA